MGSLQRNGGNIPEAKNSHASSYFQTLHSLWALYQQLHGCFRERQRGKRNRRRSEWNIKGRDGEKGRKSGASSAEQPEASCVTTGQCLPAISGEGRQAGPQPTALRGGTWDYVAEKLWKPGPRPPHSGAMASGQGSRSATCSKQMKFVKGPHFIPRAVPVALPPCCFTKKENCSPYSADFWKRKVLWLTLLWILNTVMHSKTHTNRKAGLPFPFRGGYQGAVSGHRSLQ